MQLRWSEEAAADLERITNYLFEETPQHAPELVRAIYNAPQALLTFPHRGRPGKKEETAKGGKPHQHVYPLPSVSMWLDMAKVPESILSTQHLQSSQGVFVVTQPPLGFGARSGKR